MTAYRGHCICGAIQVSLKEQPPNSLQCKCRNCARSDGGASINYVVNEADFQVNEDNALRTFAGLHIMSGKRVRVQRQFCGNCHSPVSTKSPDFPGIVLVKAALFDDITPPSQEDSTDRKQKAIKGAKLE